MTAERNGAGLEQLKEAGSPSIDDTYCLPSGVWCLMAGCPNNGKYFGRVSGFHMFAIIGVPMNE